MTTILETERLILKTSTRDKFYQVFELLSNPDVMRYIGNGPRTENEVRVGLEKMVQHQEKYGFAFGDIYHKHSGEYVGRAGLIYLAAYLGMDVNQDEIGVGYQLHKKYWGNGYATEITQGLVNWGFNYLKLNKIFAVVEGENLASQRVLQKSGFNYIGKTIYSDREVLKFQIERIMNFTPGNFPNCKV